MSQAALGWIDKQIDACDSLIQAEQMRSLRPLREAQEQIGDSRRHSQHFNEEYARVVAELRTQVDAAIERRRGQRGGRRVRRRGGGIWALFRGPPSRRP